MNIIICVIVNVQPEQKATEIINANALLINALIAQVKLIQKIYALNAIMIITQKKVILEIQ